MSERCAFEASCPMEADIIELSGACQSDRGKVCGPVAAFGMLAFEMKGLDVEDIASPIVGRFVFNTVPEGYPPLHIREAWVGVEVPVRFPEEFDQGYVPVSSQDVRLSLLTQGKLEAASWFTELALKIGEFTATFQSPEGTYTAREPVTSKEYYGARLDEQVRTTIEES